jgi:hypothetical protein
VILEVRQLVLACPGTDLVRLPVWPTVAVTAAPVPLLQEALILALQLVVEDDPPDPAA